MTNKTRLQKLESAKPKAQEDAAAYQVICEDGTITVRWQSGRVTVQAGLVPGVKTYKGISPDMWDGVQ